MEGAIIVGLRMPTRVKLRIETYWAIDNPSLDTIDAITAQMNSITHARHRERVFLNPLRRAFASAEGKLTITF
jgi:hypothetical protein